MACTLISIYQITNILNIKLRGQDIRPSPFRADYSHRFHINPAYGNPLLNAPFPPGLDQSVVIHRLALGFLIDFGLGRSGLA